jgi:hypothetical protein
MVGGQVPLTHPPIGTPQKELAGLNRGIANEAAAGAQGAPAMTS